MNANEFYLDVVVIGAEDVEDDAPLMATGRTVTAHDTLAHADALIGHDELVENVFAVGDAIFDDPFLQRMTAQDETVEDGHAVSQPGSTHLDGPWIDSVLDGSFENSQANILYYEN